MYISKIDKWYFRKINNNNQIWIKMQILYKPVVLRLRYLFRIFVWLCFNLVSLIPQQVCIWMRRRSGIGRRWARYHLVWFWSFAMVLRVASEREMVPKWPDDTLDDSRVLFCERIDLSERPTDPLYTRRTLRCILYCVRIQGNNNR